MRSRPAYDRSYWDRWCEAMRRTRMDAPEMIGTATVVDAKRPRCAVKAKPPALASCRVLIPTPNVLNDSHGHWRKRAALAKRQREAVALVLSGMDKPAGPWVVTLTRSSAGWLDSDNLPAALKHVRDATAVWLLGGTPGQRDDDPLFTWTYQQIHGKRGCPAVDIEIKGAS